MEFAHSSPLVFMYSGQGSQYFHMCKELYDNHPRFKMWMDYCDEIASSHLPKSLCQILYEDNNRAQPFDDLLYSNPALLCVEYSLSRVLFEQGFKPDYLLGYSLGELTSLVVSDALSLESGIDLSISVAKMCLRDSQSARLLAIVNSAELLDQHSDLFENTWLTGNNFSENFVVGGLTEDIDRVQKELTNMGLISQVLPVTRGFHTPLVDVISHEYSELASQLVISKCSIPVISARTGGLLDDITGNTLWRAIRDPVEFERSINYLESQHPCTYVDVGPSGTLATFVNYIVPESKHQRNFQMINPFGKNLRTLGELIARLTESSVGTSKSVNVDGLIY